MKLSFEINNKKHFIKTEDAIDISIAMNFNGPQPSSYHVPAAHSNAYRDGSFVGDTRQGGGCNFETITITPHCNGTHTECIGHITNERMMIHELLEIDLLPSLLLTVKPMKAKYCDEKYDPELNENDLVITAKELGEKCGRALFEGMSALIIRTTPNKENKLSMNYAENESAFFTNDAMEYLNKINIDHLLVDLPSIDRAHDEGKLSNHHIFWNIEQGSHDVNITSMTHKTITEFIYVANNVSDGKYLLDIQIPPFMADAAPSKPIIYPIR